VSREACPWILGRCATALVSGTVALTLAAAPSLAQAGQPLLPTASLINMPTTGMKLRSIMSLQDPADDAAAAPAAEAGPAAAGPPPTAAPAPAPAPMGPEPSRGLGLLIPGAIITGALGLPVTFIGIYDLIQFNKIQKQAQDGTTAAVAGLGKGASIAVIALGLIFLSVGAPMLGVGAYKLSKYQKWKREGHALLPTMQRTAYGTWTAGLAVNF
jgi:hypothetical protein